MTQEGKYREYRDHPYLSGRMNHIDLPRVSSSGEIMLTEPLVDPSTSGNVVLSGSILLSDPIVPIASPGEGVLQ